MPRFSTQQSYASPKLEAFLLTAVLVGFVSAQLQSITSTSTTSSMNKATISPTPAASVAMPTAVTPTKPLTYDTSFEIIIEFVNIIWSQQLLNKTSPDYIALEKTISNAVENAIMVNISNAHVHVLELKPGSVLAFLNITTNKPEFVVQETLRRQMTDGVINGLPVSKTLFSGSLFDVVLKIPAACDDSQQLKGFKQSKNLTSAVQEVLPGNVTATVQKVSCPDPQNVTIVTVRLQITNPSSKNPSQELSGLKKNVENGQVGKFPLIPEWQAYIPGEKLFSVSFDLASPSENINKTIADLGKAIEDLLRNESYVSYVTVELTNDNTTVILKVGMKTAAPEQPKEALQPLHEGVKRGKLGSVDVKTSSFKAYINPNTLTQRAFEVHFRLNLSGCDDSTIKQNQNARNAVKNYLESNLKSYKSFIKAEFQSIECVKGQLYKEERFVQAVFLVYLKPDASDKHGQFVPYLYKCKEYGMRDWGFKVVTLTPTSASANGYTHYICGPKPKTTTVQTTRPTREPSSSGTPPIELNPSLYVKLRLGITWGEFCSKLEHSLKQKIAWNLYDRNGTRVSPDRIIFINVRKSCADPSKKNEQAEVWFYVSKSGSKNLHKCLTLKAYKVLKMFLENGNTNQLGPEFEGKVIHVDLAGEDSFDHKADFDSGRLSTLAVILIAIAGAVGLVLLILAFCCLFCCGANRRRRRKREEDPQKMHVVCVDANGTDGVKGNEQKGKKQKGKADEDEGDNDEVNKRNEAKQDHDGGKQSVISHENQACSHGAEQDKDDHNSNKPVGAPAPVIVTSPAPDVQRNANMGPPASDTASSDSGGSRRGSASIGGEGLGSDAKPPSPVGLRHIDADLKDRGRRRSSTPSIIGDEDVPLTHKTGTVGIVALALRNKNENKKEAEFKNLSKDVREEEVKYPANTQSKNRSPDVLPAPRTRVKLSSTPDYINANWIRDHKGQRRYIATQHPLHETAEDFWRMVWEQESRLVVMVNEEDKEKPAEFMNYLPKGEGNTKSFGGFAVTIEQISKKPDYTLTTLSIADSKKASSSREISHMKFTSWKDRAMPNVALFVGFVTATREERRKHGDTKAPTIVHCSDGLGFTGVYIALDIGIKSHEESKTSVVDVFELSKNLRRDRHGIVCSFGHYNFIYQALYEYTVNYDESAEAQKR